MHRTPAKEPEHAQVIQFIRSQHLFRAVTVLRAMTAVGAALIMVLLLLASVQGAGLQSAQRRMHVPIEPVEQAPLAPSHGKEEREIYGQLAQTVTSFIGEWLVTLDDHTSITVVLTPKTDVRKFKKRLPEPGTWLKAEGILLPDGRLDAKRVRPDDSEPNQVVVRLKPSADPNATVQALATEYEMSVRAVLTSANIYLFITREDEEEKITHLLSDDRVWWAELNRVSRVPTGSPYRTWKWGSPADSSYVNQRAFEQVNLAPVAGVISGTGVTVAILDTGVDLEHPALVEALDVISGSDMISDTDRPDDIGPGVAWGHGTHVAGIIHAIAPAARIMPLRVLDTHGRGNTFILAYAIEYAAQQGADVINLSLGADCDSRTLTETIAAVVAQGVVIVAAAGNDASPIPTCPASLPGVIAVAAVDEQRVRTSWSNYGPWVTLAAPGEGITSTFPLGYTTETNVSPGYASWSGTSMATPFVTAAAALVLEQRSAGKIQASVLEQLTTHGVDISALNPTPYSVGRHLDIAAALVLDEPQEPPAVSYALYLPSVLRR